MSDELKPMNKEDERRQRLEKSHTVKQVADAADALWDIAIAWRDLGLRVLCLLGVWKLVELLWWLGSWASSK